MVTRKILNGAINLFHSSLLVAVGVEALHHL